MASKGKSIAEGATFVYEKLPDELVELMALDNWFDLLETVAPEVTSHKAWFQQVRDEALARFDAPEDDAAA
jgi:hypothetical protein